MGRGVTDASSWVRGSTDISGRAGANNVSEQATSAAGSDPSAAGSECAALSEQAVMSEHAVMGMRAVGRTQGLVELALGGPVERNLLDSLVRDPPRDNLVVNKYSLDSRSRRSHARGTVSGLTVR
jgi:hypothetical protein